MKKNFLFVVIILVSFSCSKDNQEQASDSLLGEWDITSIYYESGERIALGSRPDTSFTQSNTGDYINFTSDGLVSYNYSVNEEEIKNENVEWSLDHSKIKNGFTKSSVYFITIYNDEFEIQFGDRTSDAHVNATEGELIYNSNLDEVGPYYAYQLSLTKKE